MASTGGTGAWPARTSCLRKSEAVRQGAPWRETKRASVAGGTCGEYDVVADPSIQVRVAATPSTRTHARRYHTKLSEEERKDKCAPCRAALLTVTNRDSATMDEAEQALGLKASKD